MVFGYQMATLFQFFVSEPERRVMYLSGDNDTGVMGNQYTGESTVHVPCLGLRPQPFISFEYPLPVKS